MFGKVILDVEVLNHEEHREHEVRAIGLQAKHSFVSFVTFVVKNKQDQAHIP